MTVYYDREFMLGNSMLHYDSVPAIIIAIPTAIRSNLHTKEPSLTSSCMRVKYRMTIEQIMHGMSTACRVVVAVSVHSARIRSHYISLSSYVCKSHSPALIFETFCMGNGE